MKCAAKPYEGEEPNVVLIHAINADDPVVYPLAERLARAGLRIWHDEEIRKVEAEYKVQWTQHLAACSACLVYLSETAINNHVFREHFTQAVDNKKPLVIVSTVDQSLLSPAMRLQVQKAVSTVKSSYVPYEGLAEEITRLEAFKNCIGAADSNILPSAYPEKDFAQENEDKAPEKKKPDIPPTERTMLELHGTKGEPGRSEKDNADAEPAAEQDEPLKEEAEEDEGSAAELEPTVSILKEDEESPLDETISIWADKEDETKDLELTLVPQRVSLPVILCLTSGEKKKGIVPEATIGRTKKLQGDMADISFADKSRFFSRKHFQLFYIDDICRVICKHPNGMNVNGQELQDGDQADIQEKALIQIPSNAVLSQFKEKESEPAYLLIGIGEEAKKLWELESIAYLRSKATGEIRLFTDHFEFGRANPWETNLLTSRWIGRKHGEICLESGVYVYKDHSQNGTLINGKFISNESVPLNARDTVAVKTDHDSEDSFEFNCCFFERG